MRRTQTERFIWRRVLMAWEMFFRRRAIRRGRSRVAVKDWPYVKNWRELILITLTTAGSWHFPTTTWDCHSWKQAILQPLLRTSGKNLAYLNRSVLPIQ